MAVPIDYLRAKIEIKIKQQFKESLDRDPTDEELKQFTESTLQHLTQFHISDDESDEEYIPPNSTEDKDAEDNEDTTDEEDIDEVDGTKDENIDEDQDQDEESEEEKELFANNPKIRKEYEEALATVQAIAAHDRMQILESARQQYVAETGDDVVDEDLVEAFKLVKVQLMPQDDQMENEETNSQHTQTNVQDQVQTETQSDEQNQNEKKDEDENEETEDDEDEDDDEEEEEEESFPICQEQMSQEIKEAFDHIRELGKYHQQQIVDNVCETFHEINGREPELDELKSVFGRIKEKFIQEAQEEVLDDGTENIVVGKEQKSGVQTFSEDIQQKARNQFEQLYGREPTEEEFKDFLIELGNMSFPKNEDYSSENDSNYNPKDDIEQLEKDEEEDFIDDEDCGKPLLSTPIKMKENSARFDLYVQNEASNERESLEQAINTFCKVENREPSEEEIAKLTGFVSKPPLLQLLENYENDSENDSDYDPTKDTENYDDDDDFEQYVDEEPEIEDGDENFSR
jgi:hypothetical protein